MEDRMGKHDLGKCGTCNGARTIPQSEVEVKNGKPTGKMVTRQITCPQCKGSGQR